MRAQTDSLVAQRALLYLLGMNAKKQKRHRPPDPSSLAPKASGGDLTMHSRTIGVLPILNWLIRRCRFREILGECLPPEDGRHRVDTTTSILLLVRNVLISREPIYGIAEWAAAFAPELLDLKQHQLKSLNDDRVGRSLDRLFDASMPQLAMKITRQVVAAFQIDLTELHNDSTTVSFYGEYEEFEEPVARRGKQTAAIRQGHSKDHRPDLKQLLYILTVSNDGGVPVYFTTEDGDKNDDQTHIETWNLLRELTGRSDFLYVADCKLASAENLSHIARSGGRFITVLPKNRKEPRQMMRKLAEQPDQLPWKLLYEVHDDDGNLLHRFKTLREEQVTADGYRLLWIHSLVKSETDSAGRVKAIQKTVADLEKLRNRLRAPRSRMRLRHRVEEEVAKILQSRGTESLLRVDILCDEDVTLKQRTPGRRGENTLYSKEVKQRFDLTWEVNHEAVEHARRCDGVFPLLTNDTQLSAEQVLRAYKRQPIIEKRFSQLKTDFIVAPVYLKEASRIEALLCVYFMALVLQTLLERELRQAMEQTGVESLPLYPEGRPCRRPTTRRVIDALASLTRHRLITEDGSSLDLHTEATPLQRKLIRLCGLKPSTYGRS